MHDANPWTKIRIQQQAFCFVRHVTISFHSPDIVIIMCNSVRFSVYNKAIKARKTLSANKVKPTTTTAAVSVDKKQQPPPCVVDHHGLEVLSKVAALSLKADNDGNGDNNNTKTRQPRSVVPSSSSAEMPPPPPRRTKATTTCQLFITAPLSPYQCEQILDDVFRDMDDSFLRFFQDKDRHAPTASRRRVRFAALPPPHRHGSHKQPMQV